MANRIQDAFDNIKAEPQLVESTKQSLSQKRREGKRPSRRPAFQAAVAVACMALLLLAGIGGYSWVQAPVSYVAIDVNPSIELALNRFDKVVSVRAYNTEGMEILKELPLRGKLYTAAIELIMGSKTMAGYLAEGAELVFTIAADSRREDTLKSGVENCASHCGHSSQSASVDLPSALQAHKYGLSLGKYYAWLQLSQYDDTVTMEDCRDMSMAELHSLISEHEQSEGHEEEHPNGDAAQEESYPEETDPYEEEHHPEETGSYEEEHHPEETGSYEEEHHLEETGSYEEEHHLEETDSSIGEHHPEGSNGYGNGYQMGESEGECLPTDGTAYEGDSQDTDWPQNHHEERHGYRHQKGHH